MHKIKQIKYITLLINKYWHTQDNLNRHIQFLYNIKKVIE